MGSGLLREEAKGFSTRLSEQPAGKPLNEQEHVKAARQTRMRYDGVRQALIKAQLERIAATKGLSNDSLEIVSRSLKD